MHKVYSQIVMFSMVVIAFLSCNKDKTPTLMNSNQLATKLGEYCVSCREIGTTLIPDSITVFKMISFDSIFLDTLNMNISDNQFYDNSIKREIKKSTAFIKANLNKNGRSAYFYTNDTDYYGATSDPYICKCTHGITIKNDSIFLNYYKMESYDYSLTCKGIKKN